MRVRSAHNREKLKITVFLREKVGFLHGGLKVPGVRKGDIFVQVILDAVTNNLNHFCNLI